MSSTAIVACGNVVTATVYYPAALPLRTFPHVVVSCGQNRDEAFLARHLVAHLFREGSSRQCMPHERVEFLWEQNEASDVRVLVVLDLSIQDHVRTVFENRSSVACSTVGCYTRSDETRDFHVVDATLRISVYDGLSAQSRQQLHLQAREEGYNYAPLRSLVLHRLVEKVLRLVDARAERVSVRILHSDHSVVNRAVDFAQQGQWRDARITLQRFVATPEFRGLSASEKALILYDLALAWRFDTSMENDLSARFAIADELLRRALRLDPQPLFAEALDDLGRHRTQLLLLQEQQRATEHNFQLLHQSNPQERIPSPPSEYE